MATWPPLSPRGAIRSRSKPREIVNPALSPCRYSLLMARRKKLPKLRWLLAGALVAGIWVVRQDAQTPRPPESVGPAKTTSVHLPKAVERPARRPAPMTTSSIVRPQRPVPGVLSTTSRVRMRTEASVSSKVVTWLEAGQSVRILASTGKWRRVSASGRTGWVHGDYLGRRNEAPKRPKMPVAKPTQAGRTATTTSGLRPTRAPQGGDCQCPYDLMLDGSQCGEHSAYVMQDATAARCYR